MLGRGPGCFRSSGDRLRANLRQRPDAFRSCRIEVRAGFSNHGSDLCDSLQTELLFVAGKAAMSPKERLDLAAMADPFLGQGGKGLLRGLQEVTAGLGLRRRQDDKI